MKRKVLAVLLCAAMVLSLGACGQSGTSSETSGKTSADAAPAAESAEAAPASESADASGEATMSIEGSVSFSDLTATQLTPHLNGEEIKVTMYEGAYCANPNSSEQMISIYVPENATKESPIIFAVNNGGWMMDSYAARPQVRSYGTYQEFDMMSGQMVEGMGGDYYGIGQDRGDASGDAGMMETSDLFAAALENNYVIVSYGCRSRNDDPVDGEYLGHSPATVVDTKAVIRFLRYNQEALPAGNTERIVITGGSGGGALSAVIAASGNSEDYYSYLYEIGAAGVEEKDGAFESTVNDDVFATIAYCPINNLGPSDLAYEWTYLETRKELVADGKAWTNGDTDVTDAVMTASEDLHDAWPAYLESLNLKDAEGNAVTADNIDDITIRLLEDAIAKAADEIGVEAMQQDISAEIDNGWVSFEEDGSIAYDYAKHLTYVANLTELKVAPAFSNNGMGLTMMNEDSLFGTRDQQYSPFEYYAWNNDATEGNGVGTDDTGLTWDEYLETEDGQLIASQIKMASPIPYLLSDEGDSAPYWYVRHGMVDRDTSFTNQTVLYLAMENDDTITNTNFSYAWLKPHEGYYDVPEAFAWLQTVLAEAE